MIGAIITWIVFGLIVGLIGRMLVPGPQPLGWLGTIALGIAGSFAGGFLSFVFRGGDPMQTSGWIMSIIGAVIVLAVYISMSRQRRI